MCIFAIAKFTIQSKRSVTPTPSDSDGRMCIQWGIHVLQLFFTYILCSVTWVTLIIFGSCENLPLTSLEKLSPGPLQPPPGHLSFGAGPATHPWLTLNCQHLLWPSSSPSIPSFLPKDQPASWKSKPMLTVRNSCLCLPTTRPTYSQILASLVQEGSILLFVFWILLPLISLIFLFP